MFCKGVVNKLILNDTFLVSYLQINTITYEFSANNLCTKKLNYSTKNWSISILKSSQNNINMIASRVEENVKFLVIKTNANPK